jgi:hypothetical protein
MARRQGKTSPFSGAHHGAPSPAVPGRTQSAIKESGTTAPHRRKKAVRMKHHGRRRG